MAIRKQYKGTVKPKNPIPVISEETPIFLEKATSKFADGVEKAKVISFEGTTPVNTAKGLKQRAKVVFEIYSGGEVRGRLSQNFFLTNHPNQQIYKLCMTTTGRIDNVTPKDIIGKEVGVEIKNNITDSGTYSNIVDIFSVDELENDCNDVIELQDTDIDIEEYDY